LQINIFIVNECKFASPDNSWKLSRDFPFSKCVKERRRVWTVELCVAVSHHKKATTVFQTSTLQDEGGGGMAPWSTLLLLMGLRKCASLWHLNLLYCLSYLINYILRM
jgi:hypothetical protein